MRRWFALLLLVFLPFQTVWGAASVYCQHERGEASRHFGHHEHRHATSGDLTETDSSAPNQQNADGDCGFHIGGSSGFISRQHLPMPTTIAVFGENRFPSYVSHIPDGPERPDIAPAA
ncbi:MAG: hypothetical protein LBP58_10635 [Azoarcus sp.]|jgi:hypothetical protein|nr:hypothetical protein [Azoarcus sp.]